MTATRSGCAALRRAKAPYRPALFHSYGMDPRVKPEDDEAERTGSTPLSPPRRRGEQSVRRRRVHHAGGMMKGQRTLGRCGAPGLRPERILMALAERRSSSGSGNKPGSDIENPREGVGVLQIPSLAISDTWPREDRLRRARPGCRNRFLSRKGRDKGATPPTPDTPPPAPHTPPAPETRQSSLPPPSPQTPAWCWCRFP